jgi:hypothetical protein
MTKQEAKEFFARNPQGLRDIEKLRESGTLEKLDSYYLMGRAANEQDGLVNCVPAFHALYSLRKPR